MAKQDLSIVVTHTNGIPVYAAFAGKRPEALDCHTRPYDHAIYSARVEHVVDHLHAAFVRFDDRQNGFLSFSDVPDQALFNRAYRRGQSLKAGDLLAVQATRYAQGSKSARLTGELTISGQYVVVSSGRGGIHCSARLSDDQRHHLREAAARAGKQPFCLILRTEAGQLVPEDGRREGDTEPADTFQPLLSEIRTLSETMERALSDAKHQKAGTCVYQAPPLVTENDRLGRLYHFLKSYDASGDVRIICADEAACEMLSSLELVKTHEDIRVVCHNGSEEELRTLYRLDHTTETLSRRMIWLKSGAFLVIDETEAMTVIDVNSGKNIRSKEDDFYSINLEAGKEALRQLRLRDISGIIVIDFINMRRRDTRLKLSDALRKLCETDTVRTAFIGFTTLGLAEFTRSGRN